MGLPGLERWDNPKSSWSGTEFYRGLANEEERDVCNLRVGREDAVKGRK
jgi:hypothetical protein